MSAPASDLTLALEATMRVRRRLERGREQVAGLFPLSGSALDALSDDRRMEMDLLLKPWETVYELLIRRVFTALLAAEGEDVRQMTARDRVDYLEAWGILNAAGDWFALRELRNRLAHEYPLRPDYQAQLMNQAFETVSVLTGALDACRDYAHRRKLVDGGQGETP